MPEFDSPQRARVANLVHSQPTASQLISRYRLLETLGRGSFGVVCKALDVHTGDTVAIKQINLDESTDDIEEYVSAC